MWRTSSWRGQCSQCQSQPATKYLPDVMVGGRGSPPGSFKAANLRCWRMWWLPRACLFNSRCKSFWLNLPMHPTHLLHTHTNCDSSPPLPPTHQTNPHLLHLLPCETSDQKPPPDPPPPSPPQKLSPGFTTAQTCCRFKSVCCCFGSQSGSTVTVCSSSAPGVPDTHIISAT